VTVGNTNQIMAGAEVYGSDNDKIGTIADVGQSYFLVQKGFLFIKDLYLPTRTIARVDADRVYLNVTKREAEDMATEELPAEGDAWYGTSAAGMANRSTTGMTGTTTTTTDASMTTNRMATDAPVAATGTTRTDTTTRTTGVDRTANTSRSTETVRDGDTISVPVIEEQLRAGVREVEGGTARITKNVTSEQQSIDVPVQREEVYITERAVNRPATQADMDMMDREIEVPLREQEVVTSKQAVVTGEVEIRKETTTDTQRVTDTVRREEVHIDDVNNPRVHMEGGSRSSSMSSFSTDQRARHDAMSPAIRTRYASLNEQQRMQYDTKYPMRRGNDGSILDPDGDGENAFEELGKNITEGTNRPGNRNR